jgi:hypothetical protein
MIRIGSSDMEHPFGNTTREYLVFAKPDKLSYW